MRPVILAGLLFALVSFVDGRAWADFACSATPLVGCRVPFTAHKSSLAFKQTGHTDPDDIYTWRWEAGSATTVADFGDPAGTTDYALCIYDQSARPQPVVDDVAPAATGWKSILNGYKRYYPGTRSLRQLFLHAGVDGKAKILAHGDSNTVAHLLPFAAPVVVQLQASTGTCWETTLATPVRDDASRFGGKD
jgi:hypothetical protein